MTEYTRYPIQNAVQVTDLVTCFEVTYDKDFTFSGEEHDFWEIVYVASGAVGITAGDRVVELESGQIIFHQPMEYHRIWSIKGTSPHVTIMSFGARGSGMSHYRNGIYSLNYQEENYLRNIMQQAPLLFSGCNLKTPPEDELSASQQIRCWLELLLLSIRAHDQTVAPTSRTAGTALYHDLVEYMQEHLHEKLYMEEIAHACGTSVSTMKNLFRRYTDEGPMRYFNRMRLGEAKRLIAGGMSMAEVSCALGFSSQNYFSVFFKQMTGMTPKDFAASLPENEEKNKA